MSKVAEIGDVDADIDGRYAWMRLAVSVLIGTVGGVGLWAVVVVLPAVQAEFGVDRAAASLPYTLMMIGYALGNFFIGRIIDRFGFMLPAMAATLMLGLGFIFSSLAPSLTVFAILGVFVGIGAAATFGPLIADISHWFQRYRGVAVTSAACGNYFAGAIWPLVIEPITAQEGWRSAYMDIGIICLVTMVPLLLLLRRKSPHQGGTTGKAPAVRPISVSPRALQTMLIIAGLGCCAAMSMPQVHMVAYCADLGYGAARGAEMLSLMLVGGVVSRLGSGLIADRIGGIRTLLLGSILQCIALFLYIPFNGLVSLYAISLIFGLSQGGIVPCYAIIVREYLPAAEAGKRVGVVITATVAGMAFGGWISGWIYDQTGSYEAAFLNGIAWNILNIAMITLLLWRAGSPRAAMA
ncbi:MAG TPA: MFS transporter [Rhizobiaceae bacterium]|nr:MFS transporter [Rhizobiaceae bacterium]